VQTAVVNVIEPIFPNNEFPRKELRLSAVAVGAIAVALELVEVYWNSGHVFGSDCRPSRFTSTRSERRMLDARQPRRFRSIGYWIWLKFVSWHQRSWKNFASGRLRVAFRPRAGYCPAAFQSVPHIELDHRMANFGLRDGSLRRTTFCGSCVVVRNKLKRALREVKKRGSNRPVDASPEKTQHPSTVGKRV